jgi:glyoxylase-like metal-dependent hydrolase (beta-lactamase superfamily II)
MTRRIRHRRTAACSGLAAATLLFLSALPAAAQGLQIIELDPGLHMIRGRGGNVAVSSGEDRTMMVDDKFAPVTPALEAAIATFTANPVSLVLNTHYHVDHTGGNENFGEAGAVILAHDNVRQRLSAAQLDELLGLEPTDPSLPVVTFDSTVTLHLNGEEIHVFHVAAAHTDGDSIVHFRNANVIHMGDTFFNFFFPYIDVDAGGTIEGVIAAVDQGLALADEQTQIVPGHGALADRATLEAYRAMLEAVAGRVREAVAAGKTLEETLALGVTAEFDAAWDSNFMPADRFVASVYDAVLRRR